MRKHLFLACPLLLVASAAWAVPVCTTSGLDVYTNDNANNYSCTLDGLTFSNFAFHAENNQPALNSVAVMPTFDAEGDVGFIFNGAFTAGAGLSSNSVLAYTISGSGITGATASLISYGAAGAGASAKLTESLCTSKPSDSGSCTGALSLGVSDVAGQSPVIQSSSVQFGGPISTLYVTKTIAANGGAGDATISSFENTVRLSAGGGETGGGETGGEGGEGGGGTAGGAAVPEPASYLTLGSGLIAAALFLRGKLKASN